MPDSIQPEMTSDEYVAWLDSLKPGDHYAVFERSKRYCYTGTVDRMTKSFAIDSGHSSKIRLMDGRVPPPPFRSRRAYPVKELVIPKVQVSQFGEDHWSLLAYIETAAVDPDRPAVVSSLLATAKGENISNMDLRRIRVNWNTHPLMWTQLSAPPKNTPYPYGSVLKGGEVAEGHDDVDCLDDLEAAGFIEHVSLVNGIVKITAKGIDAAQQVRQHKMLGGKFADFAYKP